MLGVDPFGHLLDEIVAGKTVNGRPLRIRRFGAGQEPRDCQILFISASEERLEPVMLRLCGTSVLTVSESEGFARHGGIVNFVMEDKKVHLEISPICAERAGLRISAKLLALARIVDENAPRGKSSK